MQGLITVVQSILNMGATVLLPIMIALISIFFGMKVKDAIIAGMTVGIGFAGLNLVIGLLFSVITPAQTYYTAMGAGFRVAEIPWPMLGGAAWATPFAALVVPVGVVLNLLIFRFTKNKVINVDIWNYIHFFMAGMLAWAFTNSFWVGFFVSVALSVVALVFAQLVSKDWQEYFGLDGTTCSTLIFCAWQWPLFKGINAVVDRIPGLNKININLKQGEESQSTWGSILGNPIFIGIFVGALLGILTKQTYIMVLQMATTMAATLFLMPRMVGILMEGLAAVGTAVRAYIKKRTSAEQASEVLIGMDVALGLGDPVAITTAILSIPLIILLAFIIPGISFFPIGVIAGIPYTAVFAAMGAKGNLFRAILYSLIIVAISMVVGTIFQPEWTLALTKAGANITGTATATWLDPYSLLVLILGRLAGK